MSYVTKNLRKYLNGCAIKDIKLDSPEELNYCITMLIIQYMKANILNYQTINDIIGVLEESKMEFYRKVVMDYKSKEATEIGDLYV